MFDFSPPPAQYGLASSNAFDELRGFVEEHREASSPRPSYSARHLV